MRALGFASRSTSRAVVVTRAWGDLHDRLPAIDGGRLSRSSGDGLRRRPKQLQLDRDAGHQGEQDAGGDQPHGGLDGRLFSEAGACEQ
jgi:hypothetical protein